ncbi:MAG: threonylcarbamoyl-AMP synthase [Lachnospiraceae bacterium]|nr:threonylcarbamoyl-AMP synthase [Lachnospiraceae bacterium]
MKTRVIRLHMVGAGGEDLAALREAGALIRRGALVAFPTETVYGLGANAFDAEAAAKIYAAKGRPSDNPLIVHIGRMEDLPLVVEGGIGTCARILMARFWPGPLTLIFPKNPQVPDATTGGLATVAVRFPANEIARRLILEAGVPIAAPSANTSGRPSPTTVAHVIEDLDGKIDMILDGGEVGIGLESTIVDLTGDRPVLLRPGAVTAEMLEEALRGALYPDTGSPGTESLGLHPKAPGMKYRHYAPRAQMYVVEECADIPGLARSAAESGKRVGVLCTEETAGEIDKTCGGGFGTQSPNRLDRCMGKCIVKCIGKRADLSTVAAGLFGALRDLDHLGVDVIYAESYPREGIGLAIMNRLVKAAGGNVISGKAGERM